MADWDASVSDDDVSDVNPDELKQMLEVKTTFIFLGKLFYLFYLRVCRITTIMELTRKWYRKLSRKHPTLT